MGGGLGSAGALRQNMHKPHWCSISQQVYCLLFLLVLEIASVHKGLGVSASPCLWHPVIWYHILYLFTYLHAQAAHCSQWCLSNLANLGWPLPSAIFSESKCFIEFQGLENTWALEIRLFPSKTKG